LRVTVGFVSGIDRTFRGHRDHRLTGSLEHTAPLLPGSSSGPVLNAGGQGLGINTNRTPDDLFDALRAAPSATIELSIVRGTDERAIQVTSVLPASRTRRHKADPQLRSLA
jgi:hypothetical protein